jgi:hypothetical protein
MPESRSTIVPPRDPDGLLTDEISGEAPDVKEAVQSCLTLSRSFRWRAFLSAAFAINMVCMLLVRASGRPAVGIGAAVDMAVTVPALYFLLIVRAGLQPAISLVPFCLIGLLRATYFAPELAFARTAISAGAEIAILALIITRLHRGLRASRTDDAVERLEDAAREIIPSSRIASVLASELAIGYYAFASWRRRSEVPAGASAFTLHRQSGVATLFGFLAGISVMEAALVHVVVARWSSLAAWLLTTISVYGAIWLVAVARSLVLRPVVIARGEIIVCAGLLWTIHIPLDACEIEPSGARCDLRVPMLAQPNVQLRLSEPVTARGMYGITRRVSTIALGLDDPAEFSSAIRACTGNRPA